MEMMVIMFSPVFALALFLFLPFRAALPIYFPIFIFGVIVNVKSKRIDTYGINRVYLNRLHYRMT